MSKILLILHTHINRTTVIQRTEDPDHTFIQEFLSPLIIRRPHRKLSLIMFNIFQRRTAVFLFFLTLNVAQHILQEIMTRVPSRFSFSHLFILSSLFSPLFSLIWWSVWTFSSCCQLRGANVFSDFML